MSAETRRVRVGKSLLPFVLVGGIGALALGAQAGEKETDKHEKTIKSAPRAADGSVKPGSNAAVKSNAALKASPTSRADPAPKVDDAKLKQ